MLSGSRGHTIASGSVSCVFYTFAEGVWRNQAHISDSSITQPNGCPSLSHCLLLCASLRKCPQKNPLNLSPSLGLCFIEKAKYELGWQIL